MSDDFSPELPPVPHSDIERIAQEMERHKENPEHRNLHASELIKKSIQSMSGAPVPAPQTTDDESALPGYAQSASPQAKLEIEHLLGVALREGIVKASEEAARSNPFILDAFHDALAGRLYPELQKRGIID